VARLPEVGAPIRWLALGDSYGIEITKAGNQVLTAASEWCDRSEPRAAVEGFTSATCDAIQWHSGFTGQIISLIAFVALALICFLLAKKGAQWEMDEVAAAAKAEAVAPPAETPKS
jgi:hypothetical protein